MKQKVYLLIISLFVMQEIFAVNIALLKDTESVLSDNRYAPASGVIFAKGLAEMFYGLSPRQMKHEVDEFLSKSTAEDEVGEKNTVQTILSTLSNTATEDLLSYLFVQIGGSFMVTNAPDNPMRQLEPEHIGKILRIIFDHETKKNKMQENLRLTQEKIQNLKADENKKLGSLKSTIDKIQKFLDTHDQDLQKALKDYLVSLNFKDPNEKVYKGTDFGRYLKVIVNAVQECAVTNPSKMYPENTAQGILIGYMLAKSNTREDIEKYLSGFKGEPVKLTSEKYSLKELEQIVKMPVDLNSSEQFAKFVCAQQYIQNYVNPLPKFVENKSVFYEGKRFSDCVETMLRNAMNVVTYNKQNFMLGQAPEGLTMSPELKAFYDIELHTNPAEVGNKAIHQAWVKLVENIPGMIYSNLLVAGSKDVKKVDHFCSGVIPVDHIDNSLPLKSVDIAGKNYQVQEKVINGQTYWLIAKDSGLLCYEAQPSAANLIIIFNKLFNLNLYASDDEPLQDGFVKKYFVSMCAKVGWKVSDEVMNNIEKLENGKVSEANIALQTIDGREFSIHIDTKHHAYVEANNLHNDNNDNLIISQEQILQADEMVQASCVALGFVTQENLSKLKTGCFFYEAIKNPDKRLKMIQWLMDEKKHNYEAYTAKLIMSMAEFDDTYYVDMILDSVAAEASVPKSIAEALNGLATMSYLKAIHEEEDDEATDSDDDDDDEATDSDDNETAVLEPSGYIQTRKIQMLYARLLLSDDPLQKENLKSFFELMEKLQDDYDFSTIIQSFIFKGFIDKNNVNSFLPLLEKDFLADDSDDDAMNKKEYVLHAKLNIISALLDKKLIDANNVKMILPILEQGLQSSFDYNHNLISSIFFDLINKKILDMQDVSIVLLMVDQIDSKGIISVIKIVDVLVNNKMITQSNLKLFLPILMKGLQGSVAIVLYNDLIVIEKLINDDIMDRNSVTPILLVMQKEMHTFDQHFFYYSSQILEKCIKKNMIDANNMPLALSLIEQTLKVGKQIYSNMKMLESLIDRNLIKLEYAERMLPIINSFDFDNVDLSYIEETVKEKLSKIIEAAKESKLKINKSLFEKTFLKKTTDLGFEQFNEHERLKSQREQKFVRKAKENERYQSEFPIIDENVLAKAEFGK